MAVALLFFPIRSLNASPFEHYASLIKADLSKDRKEL
jgi:hypothetical protein